MELTIYKTKSEQLLVMPSCFLPSQEAEQIHGPLQRHGTGFVSDTHPPIHWRAFAAEIERRTYAVVTAAEAGHLFSKPRCASALKW